MNSGWDLCAIQHILRVKEIKCLAYTGPDFNKKFYNDRQRRNTITKLQNQLTTKNTGREEGAIDCI